MSSSDNKDSNEDRGIRSETVRNYRHFYNCVMASLACQACYFIVQSNKKILNVFHSIGKVSKDDGKFVLAGD